MFRTGTREGVAIKITEIKALATKPPDATRNYVFVKVSTDQGLVGWGESTMGAVSVGNVIEEIGQTLVGKDPFRIEQHWQSLYQLYHNVRGGVFQMAAISGIEIALWDIKGKALGVPVYELLGGAMRDRIWAYGRFDGDTPELAAEHARAEVDQGFSALKGDPFAHYGLFTTPEVERDAIAKVQAVREEVGQDVELMIEAHGRLTVSEAIRLGHALEAYRPFWFEEAVPPENVDAMGEAHYATIAPHVYGGPIGGAASIQLDVCTPNFLIQEGIHTWGGFHADILKEPIRWENGYIIPPTGPGLGVELNDDVLKKHAVTP